MSDDNTPDKDATEQPEGEPKDGEAKQPAAPRPRRTTAGRTTAPRAAGTRTTGAPRTGGTRARAAAAAEPPAEEAAAASTETAPAEAAPPAPRRGAQTFEGLGSLRQAMAQATRPAAPPPSATAAWSSARNTGATRLAAVRNTPSAKIHHRATEIAEERFSGGGDHAVCDRDPDRCRFLAPRAPRRGVGL